MDARTALLTALPPAAKLRGPEIGRETDMGTDEGYGIGTPTRRVEDLRFVRGLGRYTDDIRFADAAHMVVVRSPHAAARSPCSKTKAILSGTASGHTAGAPGRAAATASVTLGSSA